MTVSKSEDTIIDSSVVTSFAKISTALFYAAASMLITVVNKSVLTSYGFPSFQFLAICQMFMTVIVLYLAKSLGKLKFPDINRNTFKDTFPMPLIYLGNIEFGLGGTKELSLPMFTMLRRFSILITMLGEYYLLNIRPKLSVKVAVGLMVSGAIIASSNDLGFNLDGYIYVLCSDFLTAANGVFTKKKLNSKKEMGKYGLMFYSSMFMIPPALLLMYFSGDLDKVYRYNYWLHLPFLIQIFVSSFMGFILNYSIMLCTQYNSALTTTIIGCLKNIFVTYFGMFIGGDYVYTLNNFIGINISVIGSLFYTYVTFRPSTRPAQIQSSNTVNV
ncbi:UDP-sugar transporter UST74c isoform X1 [Daktulosphaira vitifoliae]|uniref:UDP-sugar transporter UST74c isoform X1 n=1 Tax=Daktulosphaira vitifoliae TaxID=58002 RepID=UPI0021A9C898|nr:UDP-sugar transporter UST74c isoform X1 [Daktulosphaira vitifoliae]